MTDLDGALEYLVGLQELVANFNDEGSADVPGAYSDQPATPPEPELPPSQVPGEPDEEPLFPDDSDYFEEDSDYDEVQARPEDDWWISWPKRFYMFKKGGGKGSDKGSHKGSVSQCGSTSKAVAKVQIMPASSEKASIFSFWRQKQQKIGEPSPRPPSPPLFPPPAFGPIPPGFAPLAYLTGPSSPGFPPGMQAPTPPPGPRLFQGRPHRTSEERRAMDIEAEGLKQKLLASSMCVRKPPPPPAAVLPSQTGDATTSSLWFRPTSKNKAMPKTMPGGARKNWEKQYRIVKEKSAQECLAFLERWPRPNCRNEDEIFSELFQRSMIMSMPNANSSLYKGLGSVLQEYKREISLNKPEGFVEPDEVLSSNYFDESSSDGDLVERPHDDSDIEHAQVKPIVSR
jgi:hypothetical protein